MDCFMTQYVRNDDQQRVPHQHWQAVVYHGLGQLPYRKTHPLIQSLLEQVPVVFSAMLPYHGWHADQPVNWQDVSPQVVQTLVDTLKPVVENTRTIFVTYSGAGVWLMKALNAVRHHCGLLDYGCVFIGAGLSITPKGADYGSNYYGSPSMTRILRKLHRGEPSEHIYRLLVHANHAGGDMFPTPPEIDMLLDPREKLYFVVGTHDQVYEPEPTLVSKLAERKLEHRLTVIECNHYGFFKPEHLQATLRTVTSSVEQVVRGAPSASLFRKQQTFLCGVWSLLSMESRSDDPAHPDVQYPCGKEAVGHLVYTNQGVVSVSIFSRQHRQRFSIENPFEGTADELAAASKGVIAYTGTYDLHLNRLEHRINYSLFPNWEKTTQVGYYKLEEENTLLSLYTEPMIFKDGRCQRSFLVWRRVLGLISFKPLALRTFKSSPMVQVPPAVVCRSSGPMLVYRL